MMMMISVFFATLLLSLDAVNFGFDGRFVRVEWMFLCQSERERETSFVVLHTASCCDTCAAWLCL